MVSEHFDLADVLANIPTTVSGHCPSAAEVEQIIQAAGVQGANPDREGLAGALFVLGVFLQNMPNSYKWNPRQNAAAINAAARKLQNILKTKLLALFNLDQGAADFHQLTRLGRSVVAVTDELISRCELVLKETDENLPPPKQETDRNPLIEEYLSGTNARFSRDEIITRLMVPIFEGHFGKVGFTGGKKPGGAFVRFVQASILVLAPITLHRFSPNMIREAVRPERKKRRSRKRKGA
jgi:hypothetical protein